ncbi:hypothetical protein GCM10008171_13730 [Methylopila jiangsuensis]|uniref:Transposase n=1 Tax=Methylopila jiangsuensis TaxID=586230 RepID=A0A9W6N2M0_9HYPH|nr:hypothetical protein GCM10008171_13730 [Methylopila jiangsuensis]
MRSPSSMAAHDYQRIAALPRSAGRVVNLTRVERIGRREGLKVPQKRHGRGRLWLNDGLFVRLRPDRPNHVWSCDVVEDRPLAGRTFRMLNVIAEPRVGAASSRAKALRSEGRDRKLETASQRPPPALRRPAAGRPRPKPRCGRLRNPSQPRRPSRQRRS